MENICIQCGVKFESPRASRFCTPKCRQANWRASDQKEVVIQDTPGIEDLLEWCNKEGCTVAHVLQYLTIPGYPKPGSGNWKLKYKLQPEKP
jgi:hypothetical protein